ncbi:MAG: nitroreductase family protein, partial [Chloroflexi bacterium]|nr:nitroreductase family protein [Chloroflexota bacterium]
ALQNLMLAAHARGLASCWMCAPVFCPEVVRDALDLGAELIPHALLTIGYGARPPPERERPGIEQIVTLWA